MRTQQVYTTRRGQVPGVGRAGAMGRISATRTMAMAGAGSWSRNCNTVRHTPKTLGSISNMMIVAVLVLIVGLIYVSQGTQVTNYDYQLSGIEEEIAELTAKKEDLAVERARLKSIASVESSEVASTMESGTAAGWAE